LKLWRLLLLIAAACVLFGVGLLAFNFLIMPRLVHRNTVVLVPDLRGRDLAAAHEEVRKLGLKVAETRQRPHPSLPVGIILDQTPAAATPIRRGRVVKVVTSSGPPAGILPDLAGLTRRQAEATLQREGYRLGRLLHVRQPNVTVPTVLYQYPPAGLVLPRGETVAMVVAEPSLPVVYCMPDLRGLSLFLARDLIASAGCVASSVTFSRERDQAPNTILDQSPAPGTRIRKGARIELVASTR
jgi:beta-lactam-binding protein with PASTA domain